MAEENRGGRRVPKNPASYSGVGKNSKRTDGRIQPNRGPKIQDSTDLTQGEGEIIRAGQRIAPLQRTPNPQVQAGPARGGPMVGGIGGGLPPEHLMTIPTTREAEPETEGLDIGPGAGSEVLSTPPATDDIRILALERYARVYDNPEAKQMLNRHFQRQAPQLPVPSAPEVNPVPTEAEIEPSMDLDVAEEPEEAVEEVVEEPV